VTLRFVDLNDDHLPDMVIEVQGSPVTLVDVDVSFQTSFRHVTNESTAALSPSNTGSVFHFGPDNNYVLIEDSYLDGGDTLGGATKWKYGVEALAGRVVIRSTCFTAHNAFATAAVYAGTDVSLQMQGCMVGGGGQVVFPTAAARQRSFLGPNWDGNGASIQGWDGAVPYLAPNAYATGGLIIPSQLQFGFQSKATLTGDANLLGANTPLDLGSTSMGLYMLCDIATGDTILFALHGARHVVSEILDLSGLFTPTNTPGTWACFFASGTYQFWNMTASPRAYRLAKLEQLA